MCDAEDPCSMNTAYKLESPFHNVATLHNTPFVLFELLVQFGVLKGRKAMSVANCLHSFSAFSITSCLQLTLDAGKLFSSFHSLSTAAFASRVFMQFTWHCRVHMKLQLLSRGCHRFYRVPCLPDLYKIFLSAFEHCSLSFGVPCALLFDFFDEMSSTYFDQTSGHVYQASTMLGNDICLSRGPRVSSRFSIIQ